MRLVTVATYTQAHDAHLARALLDDAGIFCHVAGEHLISNTGGFYSQAFGGVQVQVPDADAEEATRVLREAGEVAAGAEPDLAGADEADRRALHRWRLLQRGLGLLLVATGLILLAAMDRAPMSVVAPDRSAASFLWPAVLVVTGGAVLWRGLRRGA